MILVQKQPHGMFYDSVFEVDSSPSISTATMSPFSIDISFTNTATKPDGITLLIESPLTCNAKRSFGPYTWGILDPSDIDESNMGIIPIHMGNTRKGALWEPIFEDHPHTHGEYGDPATVGDGGVGSSPYTWGIPNISRHENAFAGIIPIHMGNTHPGLGTIGFA